jgi:hypothetical protein
VKVFDDLQMEYRLCNLEKHKLYSMNIEGNADIYVDGSGIGVHPVE